MNPFDTLAAELLAGSAVLGHFLTSVGAAGLQAYNEGAAFLAGVIVAIGQNVPSGGLPGLPGLPGL